MFSQMILFHDPGKESTDEKLPALYTVGSQGCYIVHNLSC